MMQLPILMDEDRRDWRILMKEVVVMLLVITSGVVSAQSIPDLAEQLLYFQSGNDFTQYTSYAFICPERGVTREELLAYNRHLGIRSGEPIGLRFPLDSDQITETPAGSPYSHPSSLISVTSNPSERSASPAVF